MRARSQRRAGKRPGSSTSPARSVCDGGCPGDVARGHELRKCAAGARRAAARGGGLVGGGAGHGDRHGARGARRRRGVAGGGARGGGAPAQRRRRDGPGTGPGAQRGLRRLRPAGRLGLVRGRHGGAALPVADARARRGARATGRRARPDPGDRRG